MMKIETGVMVMKGDKAWGIVYEDGNSTSYGSMNPEDAPIHDPKYCKKPADVTYADSYLIPELEEGVIVAVKRTTIVEVLNNEIK